MINGPEDGECDDDRQKCNQNWKTMKNGGEKWIRVFLFEFESSKFERLRILRWVEHEKDWILKKKTNGERVEKWDFEIHALEIKNLVFFRDFQGDSEENASKSSGDEIFWNNWKTKGTNCLEFEKLRKWCLEKSRILKRRIEWWMMMWWKQLKKKKNWDEERERKREREFQLLLLLWDTRPHLAMRSDPSLFFPGLHYLYDFFFVSFSFFQTHTTRMREKEGKRQRESERKTEACMRFGTLTNSLKHMRTLTGFGIWRNSFGIWRNSLEFEEISLEFEEISFGIWREPRIWRKQPWIW